MLQQSCEQVEQFQNPAMAVQRRKPENQAREVVKGGAYEKQMQEKSKQRHKPTNKEEENKTDYASGKEKIDAETAGKDKTKCQLRLKICFKLFQHHREVTLTIKTKGCITSPI